MSQFEIGFADELIKLGFGVGTVGTALASRSLSNLVSHLIVNTKASPEFIREFLGKIGKGFLRLGFKHGIEGRALRPTAKAGLSTLLDPSLIATYDTAWSIGDKVRRTVTKVPFATGKTPFQAVQVADTASRGAIKAAPYAGVAAGGYKGYAQEKDKRRPELLRGTIAQALTGGLLGLGLRAYGPSAPVVNQLHYLRKNVADKVLAGNTSPIAKFLDKLTMPTTK